MVTKMQDAGQGFPRRFRVAAAWFAISLLLAGFAGSPVAAADAGGSTVRGTVEDAAGKPVIGAVVHVYHLATETPFESGPTGSKGNFQLPFLPYGYYDLAIETPQGLFTGDEVAALRPKGKTVVTFTLREFTVADGAREDDFRSFPGAEGEPVGTATVKKKPTGKEFWKSPKGIGIIGGIAGAALLAIAMSGDSEQDASPATP